MSTSASSPRTCGCSVSTRCIATASHDAELARISATEHRTLLTRDRGLLKRSAVTHGYWLRETDSRAQLAEIVHRFDLARSHTAVYRCMACNGVLRVVAKADVRPRIPAACSGGLRRVPPMSTDCRRVFWQGSHYRRMQQQIEQLTAREPRSMKTVLFTYETPVGTFWIQPEPAGRVRLGIGREKLGTYASARLGRQGCRGIARPGGRLGTGSKAFRLRPD